MKFLPVLVSAAMLIITSPFTLAENVLAVEPMSVDIPGVKSTGFNDYWYAGTAELSRYELEQARYGELHPGEAVMVFVSEPFDINKQVKSDNSENTTGVLKLNFMRKFNTGIYPYSTMSSTFSPIDIKQFPLPLKMTSSIQEWCGHFYAQMNQRNDHYEIKMFSYFEGEENLTMDLDKLISEDAIWNMIRLDHINLPQGNFNMLPSVNFIRMLHKPMKEYPVEASLKDLPGDKGLMEYAFYMPELERSVAIQFEKAFPHKIESWQETYVSGFGDNAKVLTTKARRTHTINEPYWKQHNLKDTALREKLGLKQ